MTGSGDAPSQDQSAGEAVEIHYRRLPDRVQVFRQIVLDWRQEYVVTFLPSAQVRAPVRVGERVVLEPGSPVVWFTYPGLWHDIGLFHRADGVFTGTYANVLTPVRIQGERWDTTDLCLDVWLGADGAVEILDADELNEALARGWITPDDAVRAVQEADRLADAARRGQWPPEHVREWTLERARGVLAADDRSRGA